MVAAMNSNLPFFAFISIHSIFFILAIQTIWALKKNCLKKKSTRIFGQKIMNINQKFDLKTIILQNVE